MNPVHSTVQSGPSPLDGPVWTVRHGIYSQPVEVNLRKWVQVLQQVLVQTGKMICLDRNLEIPKKRPSNDVINSLGILLDNNHTTTYSTVIYDL